jgi:hypothetical protein
MRQLQAILKKLTQNPSGTFSAAACTRDELSFMEAVGQHIHFEPAFTDERLFNDFKAVLRSNGLLKKPEEQAFADIKPAISLYAISAMHNTIVQINNDVEIRLYMSGDLTLSIYAGMPVPRRDGLTPNFIGSDIFATSLKTETYLDNGLNALGCWGCELELTPSLRLAKVV